MHQFSCNVTMKKIFNVLSYANKVYMPPNSWPDLEQCSNKIFRKIYFHFEIVTRFHQTETIKENNFVKKSITRVDRIITFPLQINCNPTIIISNVILLGITIFFQNVISDIKSHSNHVTHNVRITLYKKIVIRNRITSRQHSVTYKKQSNIHVHGHCR